jgi:hypothetical protein
MFRIAFVLLTMIHPVVQAAQAAPQDEVKDALAHAEALYYGARFSESIALLARVDDSLKTQPGRLQEKINTKLRLALAHIGLNETAQAKALLIELYALNLDYVLDPAQFSPKVIALANEAKNDQVKVQCQTAQDDARKYLNAGNTNALLDLDRSLRSKCPGLAAIEPEAAETFYRIGVAAYRKNDFSNALTSFQAAVTLSPEHELAFQYIDLTQSKLQLTQDRLLMQWQRDFEGRQLKAAASDYKEIKASNDTRSAATLTKVNGEYRKALTGLVETWNKTCPSADSVTMNTLRNQITDLLPEPSFGEDIRSQMVPCNPDAARAAANAAAAQAAQVAAAKVQADATPPPNACVPMQSQLALTRLKTRVDPTITQELRVYLKNNPQVVVHVKVRITETGDVNIMGVTEGNPILNTAVRNAVAEWKFTPIRDQNGIRCVDTDIPIAIRLGQ